MYLDGAAPSLKHSYIITLRYEPYVNKCLNNGKAFMNEKRISRSLSIK